MYYSCIFLGPPPYLKEKNFRIYVKRGRLTHSRRGAARRRRGAGSGGGRGRGRAGAGGGGGRLAAHRRRSRPAPPRPQPRILQQRRQLQMPHVAAGPRLPRRAGAACGATLFCRGLRTSAGMQGQDRTRLRGLPACLPACQPSSLPPSAWHRGRTERTATGATRPDSHAASSAGAPKRTTLRADDLTCAAAATTLHPHRCARPSSLFPCLRVYSIGAPLGV